MERKLDFSSGEPFDDLHWSSALGTGIKIRSVFGGGRVLFGLGLLCRAEQVKAKWQESGTLAVGQEAEVADAYEALRKECGAESESRTRRPVEATTSVCCGQRNGASEK